jgi:hypothetical protein
MYDFESVSVSSYEAASLAATLTEKSAEGWEVVAIVNAGSDVVAYLKRSNEPETPTEADSTAITDGTSNTLETATVAGTSAAADLLTPTSVSSEPRVPAADTTPAETPAAAISTTSSPEGGTGWGAGTDTAASSAAGSGWSGSSDSSSWSGSAQQQATPPATPSVPAGWYADPAGRFELRYWDGTAWTEHVSRAGQQYTDPPVA